MDFHSLSHVNMYIKICVYVCIRLHLNFSRADMIYFCSPCGMLCNPVVNWWARLF